MRLFLTVSALMVLVAAPAAAARLLAPGLLRTVESSSRALTITPWDARGLALTDEISRSPLLALKPERQRGRSTDYRFALGAVQLCGHQVREHLLDDGSRLVLGTVPVLDPETPRPPAARPDFDKAASRIATFFRQVLGRDLAEVRGTGVCLFVTRNARGTTELVPVWRADVTAGGLAYHVLANADRVIEVEDGFFSVDGQGRVFEGNRVTGTAELQPLPGLKGDGTLTSDLLAMAVPVGYRRAVAPDNAFDFPPNDQRFDEVQAFYNVQKHLAFVQAQGFTMYGKAPLTVNIHTPPQGSRNNALYLEGSETAPARILIDDGDGIVLRFLGSDQDVVSHEFGHHIIFKSVTRKSGESLVLHEGLADFFVFARTGDACLGESICPDGSAACEAPGKCLRVGTNPVAYGDATWTEWTRKKNGLGHLHGQLVSGMLWGLRSAGQVPPEELTPLVLRAVELLKEDAGLKDLVVALLAADKERFGGRYFDGLRAAAGARNLLGLVDGTTPPPPSDPGPPAAAPPAPAAVLPDVAQPVAPPPPAPPAAENADKSSRKGPLKNCGSVAAGGDGPAFGTLISLLFPLLAGFVTRPSRRSARRTAA